jgi:hypothetical protein
MLLSFLKLIKCQQKARGANYFGMAIAIALLSHGGVARNNSLFPTVLKG